VDELRERIAYLQGLAEGLKLEEGKDEARILSQVIDILADLADELEDLQVALEDLEDYVDSLMMSFLKMMRISMMRMMK